MPFNASDGTPDESDEFGDCRGSAEFLFQLGQGNGQGLALAENDVVGALDILDLVGHAGAAHAGNVGSLNDVEALLDGIRRDVLGRERAAPQ